MVHRFVTRSRQTRRSDLGVVAGKSRNQTDLECDQCDKTLPHFIFQGEGRCHIMYYFNLDLASQPLARQRNLTSIPVLPRYRKVRIYTRFKWYYTSDIVVWGKGKAHSLMFLPFRSDLFSIKFEDPMGHRSVFSGTRFQPSKVNECLMVTMSFGKTYKNETWCWKGVIWNSESMVPYRVLVLSRNHLLQVGKKTRLNRP